jgi:hypothetical protein
MLRTQFPQALGEIPRLKAKKNLKVTENLHLVGFSLLTLSALGFIYPKASFGKEVQCVT